MKIYGAYGSNMNIEQMQRRCPGAKVIGKGILHDYKLTFRGISRGVANIEKCKGSSVPIVLWDITSHCERALDRYEGYPNLYIKNRVLVECKDGEFKSVMVYVMLEKYETMTALPEDFYMDIILKGYRDNGIDSKPIMEALERTENEVNQK